MRKLIVAIIVLLSLVSVSLPSEAKITKLRGRNIARSQEIILFNPGYLACSQEVVIISGELYSYRPTQYGCMLFKI